MSGLRHGFSPGSRERLVTSRSKTSSITRWMIFPPIKDLGLGWPERTRLRRRVATHFPHRVVLQASRGQGVTMVEITIQLPDKPAGTFGETPSVRSRRVLENTAIEEYRVGRISQREVGEMLGFDYWQTESFLAGTRCLSTTVSRILRPTARR